MFALTPVSHRLHGGVDEANVTRNVVYGVEITHEYAEKCVKIYSQDIGVQIV